MRAILTAALGSLMLSALPQPAPLQQRPAERPEPPRVRLRLLSEVDSLVGGAEFLLGLSYKLSPHWHIYWKNPGDSGLATRADLIAPPGFEVGPLLFPGPERIMAPGDLVNFGYEREVVLFWRVRAPEDLGDATSFEFEAQSEWLVCKEECERGDGKARIALPRAPEGQVPTFDSEAFGASFHRLPKPLSSWDGAEAAWEGSEDAPILVLRLPAEAPIGFFPESEQGVEFDRQSRETGGERTILRRWYSLSPTEDHLLPRVQGLLAVEREDLTAFYELDLTRPRADEKETR